MTSFVAFDIESTGLHPVCDRVIEISAVKFTEDGVVLAEFDEMVNPGILIPEAASKVNQIWQKDVEGKPDIASVLPKFSKFISDGSILVAHNSEFDTFFVGSEYIQCGLVFPENEIWDSLTISRELIKNIRDHKLQTLVHHYGIRADDNFHRALADSYYLMQVFLRFLSAKGAEKLREFAQPRKFQVVQSIFQVQLPLNLVSLKKAISRKEEIFVEYRQDSGDVVKVAARADFTFLMEKNKWVRLHVRDEKYPRCIRCDSILGISS